MKDYEYLYSCADLSRPDEIDGLRTMVEKGRAVKYETMLHHCCGLLDWAKSCGYELDRRQGLTLRQDWHVGYFKSTYLGNPCFFLQWSAFEFIWVKRKAQTNA